MSTVIKFGDKARVIQGVAFNFQDVTHKADHYLDQTRGQAAAIVADAQREADAVRQRAQAEGRQAALRAAEAVLDEKVGKRMQSLLPALGQAIENIQHAKQTWLAHWEHAAVKVATAIAARVIRREVRQSPEITLTLVREALELAAGSPEVRLYLHPGDHETLGTQVQRIADQISALAPIKVVADPQISPGGCRVDTQFGVIDQQFEAQLKRIEEELA